MRLPIADIIDLGMLHAYMAKLLNVLKLLNKEGFTIEKLHSANANLVKSFWPPIHNKIESNSRESNPTRSNWFRDPKPNEERKSTQTKFPPRLNSLSDLKSLEDAGWTAQEKLVSSSLKLSIELALDKFGRYAERLGLPDKSRTLRFFD